MSFQTAPGEWQPGLGIQYGNPPPRHLIWARVAMIGGVLFNLILGFPAGLVALRYARKVQPAWEAGDQAAAISASRKARTWAIVSTVLDVAGVVLLIALVAAAAQPNYSTPSVVAASIKTLTQQRLSDPHSQFYAPGVKVTSVVCTRLTATTDRCVGHFSNGTTGTEIAVISGNGSSFVTR
jgi:hypothetical protein